LKSGHKKGGKCTGNHVGEKEASSKEENGLRYGDRKGAGLKTRRWNLGGFKSRKA